MPDPEPRQYEIKIDLQGLIRLLAKNLYAEADVFVRELIQNAHDSLQRRREIMGAAAPLGRIEIAIDYRAGTITFRDNGNGLTEAEIHDYLSTIGRSGTGAFRQELVQRGRQAEVSLIGQFGIGLLSAFVVAHRVDVETRSATPGAPAWHWISEGQREYELRPDTRPEAGTTVTLHVSDTYRDMLDPETLRQAIKKYADFIPFPIYLNGEDLPANAVDAPWHREFGNAQGRLGEYWVFVNRRFPDTPLEVIPVTLEAPHRVSGVLYISDRRVPDINTTGLLDVYQARMFLMANNRDLLPLWAKFVRGVIDSPDLTPTAARDAIQWDTAAREIKEALGGLIVRHLQALATRDPARFTRIMEWHAYHMTGMAVAHDDFFDAVADLVPFETNRGPLNLREYQARAPRVDDRPGTDIFYFSEAGSATQFYLLCEAKGLLVINAVYNFDEQFLRKYAKRHGQVRLHHLTVAGSTLLFEPLSREEALGFRRLERDFQALLPDSRSQARVVRFLPADLPAVIVLTLDTRLRHELDAARRSLTLPDAVRDLAGQLFKEHETPPLILHLNAANPTIRQLAARAEAPEPDQRVDAAAREAIYHNALLLAQHLVTAENAQTLVASFNRVVALLLEQVAAAAPRPPAPTGEPAAPPSPGPIVCAVALPEDASILWTAVRLVLEQAPYYWQVGRATDDPADGGLAAAAVGVADVTTRDAQVLMQVGYLRWRQPPPVLILLEETATRRRFPAPDGAIRVRYPAAAGPDAAEPIAAALRAQLAGQAGVAALQARPHAHALSALTLHRQFGVDGSLATALAAAYPTLEACVAAPVDEIVGRVPGVSRSLARGLQAELADLLQQLTAAERA